MPSPRAGRPRRRRGGAPSPVATVGRERCFGSRVTTADRSGAADAGRVSSPPPQAGQSGATPVDGGLWSSAGSGRADGWPGGRPSAGSRCCWRCSCCSVFAGRPIVAERPSSGPQRSRRIILTLVLASGVAATTYRGGLTIALIAAITIAVGGYAGNAQRRGPRGAQRRRDVPIASRLRATSREVVSARPRSDAHQIEERSPRTCCSVSRSFFAYNLVFMMRPDLVHVRQCHVAGRSRVAGRFPLLQLRHALRRSATATSRRRSRPARCCRCRGAGRPALPGDPAGTAGFDGAAPLDPARSSARRCTATVDTGPGAAC